MKKILGILLGLVIALVLVILIRTITFRSMQIDVEPVTLPEIGLESVANLSKAITYSTVSYAADLPIDTPVFMAYHQFLAETYPLIHSRLIKEVHADFSLLYAWKGKNPELKPMILMAHMDVVPAGEADAWEKPPFSGENDGTFIWGRGAVDDKGAMIAILETVEKLLAENFVPERTIYLAFGHDEEVLGKGASAIADALKERGVDAEFVLDEGLSITKGIVPMIDIPVASIGIAEKGYLSVSLTVEMDGGHSSYPEKESAIIVLNQALYNIINNQMKARITDPVQGFLRYTGPEMPFLPRAIFANQWLFEQVIIKIYSGSNAGNAAIRTITAPTIFKAGVKDNMVPTKAEAVVNFRILPGETSDDVMKHLENVISDDRVKMAVYGKMQESSPVSPVASKSFKTIHTTVKQVFPEVMLNPMLALGATDSRHYVEVSKNIYKFTPVTFTQEDLARIHGLDERIGIADYKKAIGFYYQLIKNMQ